MSREQTLVRRVGYSKPIMGILASQDTREVVGLSNNMIDKAYNLSPGCQRSATTARASGSGFAVSGRDNENVAGSSFPWWLHPGSGESTLMNMIGGLIGAGELTGDVQRDYLFMVFQEVPI